MWVAHALSRRAVDATSFLDEVNEHHERLAAVLPKLEREYRERAEPWVTFRNVAVNVAAKR